MYDEAERTTDTRNNKHIFRKPRQTDKNETKKTKNDRKMKTEMNGKNWHDKENLNGLLTWITKTLRSFKNQGQGNL